MCRITSSILSLSACPIVAMDDQSYDQYYQWSVICIVVAHLVLQNYDHMMGIACILDIQPL